MSVLVFSVRLMFSITIFFVDGLAHVVNGEQRDTDGRERLHLHAGLSGTMNFTGY